VRLGANDYCGASPACSDASYRVAPIVDAKKNRLNVRGGQHISAGEKRRHRTRFPRIIARLLTHGEFRQAEFCAASQAVVILATAPSLTGLSNGDETVSLKSRFRETTATFRHTLARRSQSSLFERP
jgi:hypothetical protein